MIGRGHGLTCQGATGGASRRDAMASRRDAEEPGHAVTCARHVLICGTSHLLISDWGTHGDHDMTGTFKIIGHGVAYDREKPA